MCTSAAPSALASHHRLESSGHSRGSCSESPSQVASANASVPDSPRLIHAGIYAHSGCSNVASRTRLIHAGIYAHSGCSNVASRTRLIHAGVYAHSGCSNVASRTRLIHAGIHAHSGCSNVASRTRLIHAGIDVYIPCRAGLVDAPITRLHRATRAYRHYRCSHQQCNRHSQAQTSRSVLHDLLQLIPDNCRAFALLTKQLLPSYIICLRLWSDLPGFFGPPVIGK